MVWVALTALAYLAYTGYLRSQPPAELVMASTLSFQALIGLIVVGLPSVVFLFLFLLIGSIAKRWLFQRPQSQRLSQGHAPSPKPEP
jgi:hypothetical protein